MKKTTSKIKKEATVTFTKNGKDMTRPGGELDVESDPFTTNEQNKRENTMENLDTNALKYLAGVTKTITECGIPMAGSHSPASINITASNGPELTGMLKDLMGLAGIHKSADPTAVLTTTPGPTMAAADTAEPREMPSMQDLIKKVTGGEPNPEMVQDSMNDNRVYDNSPDEQGKADSNWPIDGDRDNNLVANKDMVVDRNKVTAESLFAAYQEFIAENKKKV
jgi:hypothetical protein